ncbi:MAG TPA: glycogen/starch/alpha-glucan phosphorylase [Accumulibacter sp.]|uniref:glycogen/starch/alpha-glucan phosphorylase n=1 Tax=Accumulibacter sp. TaxID=2053492 RepID=UPI0025E5E5B8|nr:glycogen/starch/alpha-glucan phosphorylase [Accumulibacter sp.]MCM8598365.1 glycogen/starch/alpha-glucan phosphorylase [Accumulibacter sp.]MCM8662993.1 glycogen/starch/alpha-glucan phosphorylase [Accumulibacter sp.]HNC50774.1 glycogen/starch/alpha-glucan phosphorylase [Accumulibacter sp.]
MSDSAQSLPAGEQLRSEINRRMVCTVGAEPSRASKADLYQGLAQVAREQLAQRWVNTQNVDRQNKARRIYYLSMEFLIGRAMNNALSALDLRDPAATMFTAPGPSLDEVMECEPDAALGNGGLGRLAACFLDSMATLGLPSWGYGVRYEYGMFAQSILNGQQIEKPEAWLQDRSPWEFPRANRHYTVRFGGYAEHHGEWAEWHAADSVEAKAFDYVIPGHGTERVSTLRLWKAAAPAEIDLGAFNTGDYQRAAEFKNRFENISWVLYPNDSTPAGRELRLRQEYFFVCASLQDILFRHQAEHGTFANLAEHVAIHLNDTHPAIGVAELMRLLVDEHDMSWADAWDQCRRIFSYTNHTLMPEALETWKVTLIHRVLPRHLLIIYRINQEFLDEVVRLYPGDIDLMRRVSLIDDGGGHEKDKRVRMANLCIVGSHRVNGVSQLHSDLMVETIFADFARLYPERFHNKTNGVTPRRWLAQANPALSTLLDERLGGKDWRLHLDRLQDLRASADDAGFRDAFAAAKLGNKQRLANYVLRELGLQLNPDSLFDVQVKRIHEYKRQLLNVLHIITRYNAILNGESEDFVPRSVIFAGKAASSYHMAKQVIRLIHDVAAVVNNDPRARDLLQVVFIPNYGVSVAELIMPAANLSEQISTAGTEASGTGNMKLSLNGALTIGTEDGANIEIRDNVGTENIFIFGNNTAQVNAIRQAGHQPMALYQKDAALKEALDRIDTGFFSPGERSRYHDVFNSLLHYGDHYLLLADYADYVATQARVDALYRTPDEWQRKAILNVAGMGPFSADRTIADYANDTWHIRTLQSS